MQVRNLIAFDPRNSRPVTDAYDNVLCFKSVDDVRRTLGDIVKPMRLVTAKVKRKTASAKAG